MSRTALLLGASGLVGGKCLELLLKEEFYREIHILTRRELPLSAGNLQQHIIDFDHAEDFFTGRKFHDVYCCLGTTIKKAGSEEAFRKVDYQYPLDIAKLALRDGAEQFLLVSALGASPDSRIFYNRVKGEVERDIQELGYHSVKIFRPSLLLGERSEQRFGEEAGKMLSNILSPFMLGGLKKYQPVEAEDVAVAMVSAAKEIEPGIRIYESDEIEETSHS